MNKTEKLVLRLINAYGAKHDLALECGSEYISQDDSAQIDAIELVGDIFDVISESEESIDE